MPKAALEKLFSEPAVFLTGNRKNAGKTTVLNHLVRYANSKREAEHVSLFSIGWDGEGRDRIFENRKPEITVFQGMRFLTAEYALSRADFPYRILSGFSFRSNAGNYYLCQALAEGKIELIGPEANYQLDEVFSIIKESMPEGTVLIDGALDRISQMASRKAPGFVFIFSPLPGKTTEQMLADFRLQLSLFALPKAGLLSPGESEITGYSKGKVVLECGKNDPFTAESLELVYIKGALTRSLADKFPGGLELVVQDFTRIFLGPEIERRRISVLEQPVPLLFCYNPGLTGIGFQSIHKELLEMNSGFFPSVRLLDVMELEN
ncbi:MAG: hypothetical protein PHW04_01700 [Candidatus Wallbacteria bacterium]|nr:hypothetical protein [Candidatus Wallbacteria bacterium]